ncbi:MAG: ABC transporter permease [Bacteroides sp.]|nr:ABC transporter permease [Bacteroides sp.]MCM1085615.1 ABC transporter permease [Bacteroides sp.]
MKDIRMAFRTLFRKGRYNVLKIVSLAIGLAVSLVLLAQVFFERSFEAFWPDADRLYLIANRYSLNQEAEKTTFNVSGGVPAGVKAEIPGVEDAIRYTPILGVNTVLVDGEGHRITTDLAINLADSNFFDLFPVKLLGGGNPKQVLARLTDVMISRSLAEKLGGVEAALDKRLSVESMEGLTFTVGGVYEDMPENSLFRRDVIGSCGLMGEWSLSNWVGNDRYTGVVKLQKGVAPESLRGALDEMMARHVDPEEMHAAGYSMQYELWPLRDRYLINEDLRARHAMMLLLAVALLATAMLNYALISLSSIVNRGREVAVHKTYGAGKGAICRKVFAETAVHTLLALCLSALLVLAARGWIYELLGVKVSTLLGAQSSWGLAVICLALMFVTGILPGVFMARIPVSDVFRRFSQNKKTWKLALLAVQFAVFAFLLCLLVNVGRQYRMMVSYDPGYEFDNLAYYDMSGLTDGDLRMKLVDELQRLPQVDRVSCGSEHFAGGLMSGNNISFRENRIRELFNVADLYYVGNDFIQTMGMRLVEGGSFTENVPNSEQIMVSESFVEKMKNFADWSDGAVGKEICITEHQNWGASCYTICGVYENVLLGGIGGEDPRPSVLFYSSDPQWYTYLWVRFHELTGSNLAKADSALAALLPDREASLRPYRLDVVEQYRESARFRDKVLAGGVVCLLITLMGLLGYINDEVTRRRKEISIRRVNGADENRILKIFTLDVLKVALPAAVAGAAASYWVSFRYLQQFSVKVALSVWVYPLAIAAVLAIGYLCVRLRVRLFLRENPIEGLRTE